MARKILLADDSVTAQNMGRKILADAGYEVITVNNGSAALKRIPETKPDLIVLDVYMPGYSGLEVCARLKESSDTSRIPIVLTVGKLEPFKPEEAKRVRADGFIVKPFEASELLSALSKLEDRIVPRAEAAKPGRFARANAALDAPYDKSVTMEDSSWKNRISFPTRKKAAEPEAADDPSISNAVNKDLRTSTDLSTVESKKTSKEAAAARVDLGALAPEGLPKDVTPEEIAALAAAAAQVKGKLSETEAAASVVETIAPPKPVEAAAQAETNAADSKATSAAPEVAAKPETQVSSELPKEPVPATFVEPTAPPESKVAELPAEAPTIAASADLTPTAGVSVGTSSGNGTGVHEGDQPVTMAVVAGADYSLISPRWKAVPVAVLAEEAALSLEEEMRKALAAVAAAEMAEPVITEAGLSAPEAGPVVVSEVTSTVATAVAEPPVAAALSEAAQTVGTVASVATDAITEAVKELEAVAASYTELHKPLQPAASQPEESAVASAEPEEAIAPAAVESAVMLESEASPAAKIVEAKIEAQITEAKIVEAQIAEAKIVDADIDNVKLGEKRREDAKSEEVKRDEPKLEDVKAEERTDSADAEALKQSAPEFGIPVAQVAHEIANAESEELSKPAAQRESALGGVGGMAKNESEMTEHTAAAWASWRRIRDDGKSGSSKGGSSKEGSPKDSKAKSEDISIDDAKAAMAVAAGAEKSPEEAAAGEDSEVSAIVDSVLADLRPKIVEEISRKLGKKK